MNMLKNGDFEVIGNGGRWARIASGEFYLRGRTLLVFTGRGNMLPLKCRSQVLPTDTRLFTLKAWGAKGYA